MKTNQYKLSGIALAIASAAVAFISVIAFLVHFPLLAIIFSCLHVALFVAWCISMIVGLIIKKMQLADWKYYISAVGGQLVASLAVGVTFLYALANSLSSF